jgi:hypothetical protein
MKRASAGSWILRGCLALGAFTAALQACTRGGDHTDVCVGPGCETYDGTGGSGNTFYGDLPDADVLLGGSGGAAGYDNDASVGGAPGDAATGVAGNGALDAGDAGPGTPCQIGFVTPLSADAGDVTLSGSDDIDGEACGPEFTISVEVTSNAHSVTLFINENPLAAQDVVGGGVHFDAVLGNRGATPNTLRARATMTDGRTCDANFGSNVLVDCPGPSCTIDTPVSNDDGYLNGTLDTSGTPGLQTDVIVSTEADQAGQTVRFGIDGHFAVVADAVVAGDGRATFANVPLSEGTRTVQAECRDSLGDTTLSPETVWQVDTTPCSLFITSIAGGADPITPGNDIHSNEAGLQVLATGQITGGDCRTLWIGTCGGALAPLALSLPPNGNFSIPITLSGATGPLHLCGSVEDNAGNRSSEQEVDLNLRLDAPQVAFFSPVNGDRINLTGSNGGLVDGDPLSSACETDILVNCTEVGQAVQLLVDGNPVTSATCVSQSGLSSPFTGRATFSQRALASKNDGTLTLLTASQSASGLPTASASVSVQADCEAPICNLVSPGASTYLNAGADSALGTLGFQIDFDVASEANSVGQSVQLILDNDTNGALNSTLGVVGGASGAHFAAVSWSEGPHRAQAKCSDATGNTQTSSLGQWIVDTVPCSTSFLVAGGVTPITPIVAPGLVVQAAGSTGGGDCVSARAGLCSSLGGTFTALDPNSQAYSLPVTLANVTSSQNVCVQVTDLAGNVSTPQSATVAVRVDPPTVALTAPLEGAAFNVLSTCSTAVTASCSDDGAPVTLFVDTVASSDSPQVCSGGTATFQITLASKNDGTQTTLAVQQTADGLTSTASTVHVQADCQPPTPTISSPSCGSQLAFPEDDGNLGVAGLQHDLAVLDDGLTDVSLLVTPQGGATNTLHATGDSTTATFPLVDLGGLGSVSLSTCVTDAQGNQGCSTPCSINLVDHPVLAITSPLDHALLNSQTTDCNTAGADAGIDNGLDVVVSGTSNAVDGSAVALTTGSGATQNTTVSGGHFSACVAAPQGFGQTLSALVTDLSTGLTQSTSIQVDVDSVAPTDPIAAPSVSIINRRPGSGTLTWNAENDTGGGTLSAYHLRCSFSDITDETTWGAALELPMNTVPVAAGGPAQSETFAFKTGFDKFCVIRGEDPGGQLTPIAAGQSTEVVNAFLKTPYTTVPSNLTSISFGAAAIGDINGDLHDDFIVGTDGQGAKVYFGGPTLDTTPGITINVPSGAGSSGHFGNVVVGLGDINGDSLPDFAVSGRTLPTGAGNSAGSVYIFFGRDSSHPWPSTFNPVKSPGCGADLCLHGSVALGLFGNTVVATDFNGDHVMDVVVGAANANASAGRVYVLLGGAQLGGGILNIPSDNPNGFIIDPPGTAQVFGANAAAVGNGADALGDLVVGASGVSSPGAVFFLAGEAYPATIPATTGLVTPVGALTSFATGTATDFGFPVAALGDFNGDGFNDVCVGHDYFALGGICNVYLGQTLGFAGASSLLVYNNDQVDNDWSTFAASGFHSSFGLIGDLDKDGTGELALGSKFTVATPARPGTVELFYGGIGVSGRARSTADARFQTEGSGSLGASFVGDIDGDGFNDMAIYDSNAGPPAPGTPASKLTLLH